jgi:hypothetical protein
MKNLKILSIAILCLGITACIDGQMRRTVYGNNHVVKRDRQAGSFNGVRVSTGINVYLKQGDNESISVEADENLHEYIRTEISGGTLNVYSDANIRKAEMKNVYVTMKNIELLKTTSAGDIIGQTPIKTDDLELSASSAGDIKLEAYVKNLKVDISSSGSVTISGEGDSLNADLSSAGDLNAYDFKVRDADVSASSAGDADIFVTEKLTARASSAGDINYNGDPKYIDAHSSSAGGVHKK